MKRSGRVAGALVGLALIGAGGAGMAGAQEPPPVVGDWAGSLDFAGARLKVVFHVARTDGGLAATLDSPDQGAYAIPVSEVRVEGDSVELAVAAVAGGFAGRYDAGSDAITGTWSQGGLELPLALARSSEAPPKRPQEPTTPFPYEAREVTFDSPAAGIELAGTLTLPAGDGPHAAVVLVSGSGPQDRDETVFGHRPFLVLADHLTRRGIAVLRYDDRGVGESEGDFAAATSRDFASDAAAAVYWLAGRPEIDPDRIGILGHSEGALVAPMVANGDAPVAFVILLAGPGVPGEELLYAQGERIVRAGGGSDSLVATERATQERLFAVVREEPDSAAARDRLMEILARAGLTGTSAEAQVRAVTSPWMRFFLDHDPRPDLERLAVPVLALTGGKDTQVPPDLNLPEQQVALERSRSQDFTVRELPGLNHLFQRAETGSPTEYGKIEETMAPAALEAIGDWILERTG
ncbi:MAG: alpha/beta fold hydrolase [Gemmatimonadota bacterium]